MLFLNLLATVVLEVCGSFILSSTERFTAVKSHFHFLQTLSPLRSLPVSLWACFQVENTNISETQISVRLSVSHCASSVMFHCLSATPPVSLSCLSACLSCWGLLSSCFVSASMYPAKRTGRKAISLQGSIMQRGQGSLPDPDPEWISLSSDTCGVWERLRQEQLTPITPLYINLIF